MRSISSFPSAARSALRLDALSALAVERRSSGSCLRSASAVARPGRGRFAGVASAQGGGSPSRRRVRRSSTTGRRDVSSARGRSVDGDALRVTQRLLSPRSSRDRASTRSSPCRAIRSVRGAGATSHRERSRTSWGGCGISRRSRCWSGAAPFLDSADCRSSRDARTSVAASSRTTSSPRACASSTTSTPPVRPRTRARARADGSALGTWA